MQDKIQLYSDELKIELNAILSWWKNHSIDHQYGGFLGEIRNDNQHITNAAKGIVLNSRILWTFAEAYLLQKKEEDLLVASRAFDYIRTYFYDQVHGGFYWSLNAKGDVLDGKKQIYGQAFTIYGLSAYFKATGDDRAIRLAIETYRLIEKYSFDTQYSGYTEAFSQNWQSIDDLRLSDKDLNSQKSMNTHLHIIEAYASLYGVWKDDGLAQAIKALLAVFKKYIISNEDRLHIFFSNNWEVQSNLVSYGHDIEAAWLLQECAEAINDRDEIKQFKNSALRLAANVDEGIDKDGGLYYELELKNNHLIREKHWWPQAEAMVGYFNAYQLSGDFTYLSKSLQSWTFIKTYLKDQVNGEWYWGVYPDYSLMNESKAGFWKCPYHNGRACIEIIKRIANL